MVDLLVELIVDWFEILAFFRWVVFVLLLFSLFVLMARWGNRDNLSQMTPNAHECPECKGDNLDISMIPVGASTISANSKYSSAAASSLVHKKIAVCQDCGADFAYFTAADVEQIKARAERRYRASKRTAKFFTVLTIVAFVTNFFAD